MLLLKIKALGRSIVRYRIGMKGHGSCALCRKQTKERENREKVAHQMLIPALLDFPAVPLGLPSRIGLRQEGIF